MALSPKRVIVSAVLALSVAGLSACSSSTASKALTVGQAQPVATSPAAAPPFDSPPAAVPTYAYLGPVDINTFCTVNFPDTVAAPASVVTNSGTWSCGGKWPDGTWAVTVDLSPQDMTAACIQQYGDNAINLHEEAVLKGSILTGWDCYSTTPS